MFVNIACNGIQPTGPVVYTGVTTAVTCRYRGGRPIEIRNNLTFQVFVDGHFEGGWGTRDQAIAHAQRFGIEVSA